MVGLAALAMLIWTKGPAEADMALEWIILGERSARFLQVCLLIVAIAMMSRLGLDLASLFSGNRCRLRCLCGAGSDSAGASRPPSL